MEKSLVIQGRQIGPVELDQVRGLLAAHPEGSRYRVPTALGLGRAAARPVGLGRLHEPAVITARHNVDNRGQAL
jgi:hypothetical protein